MKWASTVSVVPSLREAVAEAARSLATELDTSAPDLLFVFVSAHHAGSFDLLPELLAAELPSRAVIGCSAGGVIGAAREVEVQPGLALTGALLPGVRVVPFHAESEALPPGDAPGRAWRDLLGLADDESPHFVLLPDPFSFDVEGLLRGLDRVYPESRKIGGLASGGRQPGGNALYLGGRLLRSGTVGVALAGAVHVDTIVAQGCRPIGQPMFVTRSDRNVVWELDGRRPLEVLRELHDGLDQHDRVLARHSLFLGIAMSETLGEYRQGDFLIRNLIGADAESGAVAVGAVVEPAAIVQFHLRDSKTSAEDLESLLARYRREHPAARPAGALLFSCLGRGRNLYGHPDHDTGMFRATLGPVPLGGFFCSGEIGPVRGATFLHGYTSAFGLFSATRDPTAHD